MLKTSYQAVWKKINSGGVADATIGGVLQAWQKGVTELQILYPMDPEVHAMHQESGQKLQAMQAESKATDILDKMSSLFPALEED
eukprot:6163991-Pyramimonas_sp.AAC.1